MSRLDIAAQLAQESAAAALEREARRFASTVQLVRQGESTQEMLRAARARLEHCALAKAMTHGWQPPPSPAA
jgi:hypothetical protein